MFLLDATLVACELRQCRANGCNLEVSKALLDFQVQEQMDIIALKIVLCLRVRRNMWVSVVIVRSALRLDKEDAYG